MLNWIPFIPEHDEGPPVKTPKNPEKMPPNRAALQEGARVI